MNPGKLLRVSVLCVSFFLVTMLTLLLGGCGGSAPQQPATEVVSGLRIETVRPENVPDEIEAPGTVASVATAQIAARTTGTVERVAVREGDRVRRGQLLIALDERELVARRDAAQAALHEAAAGRDEAARAVAAAQAQADVAAKTYDRYVFLRDQKSVSPQEFDEVEGRQRAAQAALAQAKARAAQTDAGYARAEQESGAAGTVAGYARILAPFDGTVVRRLVEPGSTAAPGMALLIVEDSSRYRLEATVEAADSASIRRGSKARIRLDAIPGKEFAGTVAELEAGADPTSHTVQAKVDLPADPAVRSGLFGRAWFRRGDRRAIAVSANAIFARGQLSGVYIVDPGGIARLRLVTVGARFGERLEVLSGLGDGERIVADPAARELDGKRVEGSR
jgi:RND family efflux transporter MFP subunit